MSSTQAATKSKLPTIPSHATVFDASGGTVSVYRDGNNVVLVGMFGESSSVWTMNRAGACEIASAIINHAITTDDLIKMGGYESNTSQSTPENPR